MKTIQCSYADVTGCLVLPSDARTVIHDAVDPGEYFDAKKTDTDLDLQALLVGEHPTAWSVQIEICRSHSSVIFWTCT
uniref:Uncharacterized protein n=1 Tax=Lepeophtheirus salmonis TaxID=72036 RepID=A0A0K2V431_LEPSM